MCQSWFEKLKSLSIEDLADYLIVDCDDYYISIWGDKEEGTLQGYESLKKTVIRQLQSDYIYND